MDNSNPTAAPSDPSERRRTYVSPEQRIEREAEVERLLVAGVGQRGIERTMHERHGMTVSMVRSAASRVRKRWADEERDNRPSYKAAAMRRLMGHIAAARGKDNYAAIAQLERLLAEMQGTREPEVVNLNVETSLPEAAMRVIAQLSPERFQALVLEQRKLRELAAAKSVVETTGEVKVEP